MKKLFTVAFVLITLLGSGCARVQYFGDSLPPTMNIETFYDENDITRDYKVIGHAVGEGPLKQVRSKLIKKAEQEGAQGIIFRGFQPENDGYGAYNSGGENNTIAASFIVFR